jgi:hypothetical protein
MTVCRANEVKTELMNAGYLPQANEACLIPIVPQTEKLHHGGRERSSPSEE